MLQSKKRVRTFYEMLNDKTHKFSDTAKYEKMVPTRDGTALISN